MKSKLLDSITCSVIVISLSTCAGVFIREGDYILGVICIAGAVGVVVLFWNVLQSLDYDASTVDALNDATDDQLLHTHGQRIKTRLLQELSEHPDLEPHMVQSVFVPTFTIVSSEGGDVLDLIIYMVIKRWPGSIQYDWINVRKTIYWTFQVESEMDIIRYIRVNNGHRS